MKVLKFGGISVKDAESIKKVEKILKNEQKDKVVVVSAFFGVTDKLEAVIESIKNNDTEKAFKLIDEVENNCFKIVKSLKTCRNSETFIKEKILQIRQFLPALALLGEITPRSVDMILSYGERISSFVIADYLNSSGIRTAYIDALQIIRTDGSHNKAAIDISKTSEIAKKSVVPLLKNNCCIITGGFIGADDSGSVTTLGRGGSDYTASVLAVSLSAESLEIWKEVDGIMTTDPKIVATAKPVSHLSYKEASELAFFGAKVLHPKTIRPAIMANIPVYVKKTSQPDYPGTLIEKISRKGKKVKAAAFQKNVTIINICSEKMLGEYGFLSNVFNVFTKYKTPVDLITTSEINISVTIDSSDNLNDIVKELSAFSTVDVTENVAIISLVGEGIKYISGIAAKCFTALHDINVLMVSMGASEVNLNIIVKQEEMVEAVSRLHFEFFEKTGE
jgi:aspartate kinase